MEKRTNLMLVIEKDVNVALKILAAKKGISKGKFIESILSDYVKANYQA